MTNEKESLRNIERLEKATCVRNANKNSEADLKIKRKGEIITKSKCGKSIKLKNKDLSKN